MSTDRSTTSSNDNDVKELSNDIEHTRAQMSTTIHALEQRLSPAELGQKARVEIDHIEARVKAVLQEGLHEAKDVLKEQVHEAKEIVTEGVSNAREALKKDIHTAIANTKQGMRDATIGRVENIATQAGDFMNTTRDTLVDTVRDNPIPAAIAGIGLAWLLMNRSTSSRRRNQDWRSARFDGMGHAERGGRGNEAAHQVGSALSTAGAAVGNAAHTATDAVRSAVGHGVDAAENLAGATGRLVHDATDATGHLMHDAADTAGHFAHGVQRSFQSKLQTNPLAIGAVAVVAGVAMGYSLPRTQQEDKLMGEARDRMLGGATEVAHDAAQALQHVAGEVRDTAKEALSAGRPPT